MSAYRQKGYSAAGSSAKRHSRHLADIQDIPAAKVTQGAAGFSGATTSAAGIPGYYSSQRGKGVTKSIYRRLAALSAGGPIDPTDVDDQLRWCRAQGIYTGLDGELLTDGVGGADTRRRTEALAQCAVPIAQHADLGGFSVKLERDDVEFLETKRKEEMNLAFDQWLVRRVNLDQPENARWIQEIYPDFYDRRERFIDDKINVEAALAKIRLRGVKDQNDLKLLFAVNTGLVQPSTRTMFAAAAPVAGTDYQQGMLSMAGWFGARTGPLNFDQTAGANRAATPFGNPSTIHDIAGNIMGA